MLYKEVSMKTSASQSWSVGVVISAYNEAENLPRVLNTVCAAEWLQEIIVVDDGSTDATEEVAQRVAERDCRLVAIRLPENQGKAAAMLAGVRALHTDLVIFLDADLVGLKPLHLQQLASLQKSGSSEMAIALFQHGRFLTDISHRFVPNLTGQRCLWRLEAEEALIPLAADRYGVETGLTIYARNHHWQVRKIIWYGVTHRMREQKRKVIGGLYSRWQMYGQIMIVIARNRYGNRRGFRRLRSVKKTRLTLR
jgi:glycosyltransferase involved in cell wall biosynthesis